MRDNGLSESDVDRRVFCFDAGAAAIRHLTKENLRLSKGTNPIELHQLFCRSKCSCCLADKKADCTLTMSDADLQALMTGKLNPQTVRASCLLFQIINLIQAMLYVLYTWLRCCFSFLNSIFSISWIIFDSFFLVRENTRNCSSQNQHFAVTMRM